ncbi:phosphonate metabolism protein/1,5-bisphosphokinase (PRPP-forming) PhnN [Marivibrio halodurans]|uniref:Ribose 1,5-bisphosphate phosphokinase PhnN n=1 Tax=Marivibrio halodurans TaxID=2039722 RepID=A0A8J7V1L1_9PROT|nr:phosphonate metabolism protein/1,5-bisphosphokinase (PRPP-forming) PhnN [Marivibrio halodurans]MBP5856470.1 phosphonate metabolism protein/1,5-bisphosphokinase (PRPP-forming) PhnN [Marivibrio halodurans]
MPERAPSPFPGRLVLVVGPSGAGKDSVMRAARDGLPDGEPDAGRDIRFVTRWITRPAEDEAATVGEAHRPVDPETFERLAGEGAFALHWAAHGLRYGLPVTIEGWLAEGAVVVANVSRTVIDRARARYPGLVVLHITAAPAVRARRLAARGREGEAEVAARLARADLAVPEGGDVVMVANDGDLAAAAARVRDLLLTLVREAGRR